MLQWNAKKTALLLLAVSIVIAMLAGMADFDGLNFTW